VTTGNPWRRKRLGERPTRVLPCGCERGDAHRPAPELHDRPVTEAAKALKLSRDHGYGAFEHRAEAIVVTGSAAAPAP